MNKIVVAIRCLTTRCVSCDIIVSIMKRVANIERTSYWVVTFREEFSSYHGVEEVNIFRTSDKAVDHLKSIVDEDTGGFCENEGISYTREELIDYIDGEELEIDGQMWSIMQTWI